MRARLAARLCLTACIAARASLAAGSEEEAYRPLRTWGAPSDEPPPAPPPATVGTPADDTTVVTPPPPADAVDARAPSARPGLRYVLDGVEVRGNRSTLTRVVLRSVPFKAGDALDVDDPSLEAARFALLGTGYFRDVQLSLRKGTARGRAFLVVTVEERNTIVVNELSLGVSADVDASGKARPLTAYGGLDVSENNLGGTGTILGGALAVADQQIGLRTRVFLPRVAGSPLTVGGEALFNQARDFFGNRDVLVDDKTQPAQDFAVARYKRFGGRVSLGWELSAASHVALDYRLEGIDAELPQAASQKRGTDIEPIDFHLQRGGSLLSTVRGTFVHDTRDEPLLSTRGWFVQLALDGAFAGTGSSYSYFKIQGRAARWFRLPWKHVVRVEGWAGALFGDAPLFERFYVGDLSDLLPDRVLDLAFDRRPAPNVFGTAIGDVRYGDYGARLFGEYRVPLYRGRSAIYGVDLFGLAGVYVLATPREITDPSRQWQGAARLPIDLTFNLGVRVDTAIGGINLGLSTLIGFIPLRGGSQ